MAPELLCAQGTELGSMVLVGPFQPGLFYEYTIL